ncbi:hypothetical protein EXT60_05830 [Pectobacterium carotovorum subsp. carotovorum]|nr:hypothetical protein [Pectobacterium carotovorum]MCL6363756.1 hypothetical protein [Pectobacterium carotovorum subsp. carotovorum]
MHDIYQALTTDERRLNNYDDQELVMYRETCHDAAFAINSALRVIGNLTLEANESDEYDDADARRDLLLIGAALRHLPSMAMALTYNADYSGYVMDKRKEATK